MDTLNPQTPIESASEQPLSVPPKPSSHSKLLLITLIVFIIIMIGLTSYLLVARSKPTSPPSSTISPTLSQPSPTPQTSTFQKILEENCIRDNSAFGKIRTEELPITINPKIVNAIELSCGSIGTPHTWYVSRNSDFFIFDESSDELGHGGISYFKPYREGIMGPNGIKYYTYLPSGVGPWPISETPVNVRAIKELKINNNESIYISTTEEVIEGEDPRLVNLLNQYSILSENYPGQREVSDYEKAEDAVSARFFGNFDNLESPEREKIEKMKQILGAFSEK